MSVPFSPVTHSAEEVVSRLQLEPLPQEGGFFRRTAAARTLVDTPRGPRPAWSMILALFTPRQFSALHCVAHDELWCFHAGDPLELTTLHAHGSETVRLGFDADDRLQHVVPASTWQGATPAADGAWSLVTCMVVPAFGWEDFELGRRETLATEFPSAAEIVRRLTR